MKSADLTAAAAKLELSLKVFRNTWSGVEPQWTDTARREFQETYIAPMEPKTRELLEAITRLAGVIAAAEHQCGSESR